MPNDIPNIVTETATLTKGDDTTGWTSTGEFTKLGRAGKILNVSLREDPTDAKGSAATLVLTDGESGNIDGNTLDSQMVFKHTDIALTGSATAASLEDNVNVDGGAYYSLGRGEKLKVAANITAVGGGAETDTVLYATIRAEVYR